MTKSVSRVQIQSANKPRNCAPPSKPGKLALAVSMAMGAAPVAMAFDNQVDVWARPGTDRSYGGIEGVLPFSQSGTSLTFADLKFKLGQSGSYEGNLGLGHRFLTDSKQWALGFYGAWDHRNSPNDNAFNQIAVGAEAISDNLDFRVNYYYPLTDRALLGLGNNFGFQGFSIYQSGIWEEAMKGFDLEAGVLLPVSDKWETRAYAAYYNFEGKDIAPETDGWRVRLEVRPTNNIAVSLSHQQDDMFKDQTSLELRYTFGKDGKSGVRSLKERMTTPWTRDIDIVVSTPQEGAANSSFGKVVQAFDGTVVHINSAYTGGASDGSYERPYTSVSQCETAGGTNGKCYFVGGSVSGALNTTVTGDYNVIRLWEGTSQTDGGYTPITLLNGQMLAGEPITARNIVNLHPQGFWTGVFDPIDNSLQPVISGDSPAVILGSNTSVLGVHTVYGGIVGTNVSGRINISYNTIDARYYSGGVGININNTNVGYSNINIGRNAIYASATGISLSNTANDGTAVMYANIHNNQIGVDGADTIGIQLRNSATNKYYGATASQFSSIYDNFVGVAGRNSATGISLGNNASDGATATQNTYIVNNGVLAIGGNYATGVAVANSASKYGQASQHTTLSGNYIFAVDLNNVPDGAVGVQFTNNASKYGSATQTANIVGNYIDAASVYGNATGVSASNAATSKYNGHSVATQNIYIGNSRISATGGKYYGVGAGTGISMSNTAGSKYAGTSATATQTIGVYSSSVSASGDSAEGISATNRQSDYAGGTTTVGQHLYVDGSSVAATARGYAGSANGISLINTTNVAGVNANQTLFMYDSGVSATANGVYGNSTGLYMRNSAGGGSSATQSANVFNSTITARSNWDGYSTGVHAWNNASAATGTANATQSIGLHGFDGGSVSVSAYSWGGGATGIDITNDGVSSGGASAYARQDLNLSNFSVSANSYGNGATGISASNYGFALSGGTTTARQTPLLYGGSVSAYDAYANTIGMDLRNNANASADGAAAASIQRTAMDGVTVSASSRYGAATGISMNNAGQGRYATGWAIQSLLAYDSSVSASSSWGAVTGVYAGNFAPTGSSTSDGGSTSNATQDITFIGGLYNSSISATSQYYTAIGINAVNLAQSQYQGNYSTATATQRITLDGMSVRANGDGATMGIRLSNAASGTYSADYATVTATQTLGMTNTSVSANSFNGNAVGLAMYNSAYVPVEAGGAEHTATQRVTASNGSSIYSHSSYGQYVAGVYAANTASMSNWNTYGASSTANQYLTLNNSSVTAGGNYYVAGIYARNSSGNYSNATQLITLNNSGVSAYGNHGGQVVGINARNTNGFDGTSTQTVALAGGSVYTYGSNNGAGIAMFNEGSTFGVASQTLTATGVNITAYGYNQAGVMASTAGRYYGGGNVVQSVTLAGNNIAAPSDRGTSFYSAGNTLQLGSVTGNTVSAGTGVYMNRAFGGGQIVTVSGNTFNTTTQTSNVGGGTCVGTQCAP